ncbi:MAG: hypothetical protein GX947_07675 [Tissierellia bacterium]|nr:hypothetical protein [Tissierellia bacterium]
MSQEFKFCFQRERAEQLLINNYYQIKKYLIEHSINDSFPEMVDHTTEDSIICLIDDFVL